MKRSGRAFRPFPALSPPGPPESDSLSVEFRAEAPLSWLDAPIRNAGAPQQMLRPSRIFPGSLESLGCPLRRGRSSTPSDTERRRTR